MRLLRRRVARSVALLLNLLLLQVTVLGGGAACAGRATGMGLTAASGAAPVHGEHHGGRHGAHDTAPSAQPSGDAEVPPPSSHQLPHCGLAAGCLTPAALASRAEPLSAHDSAAGLVRIADDRAPHSAVAAPEPPPPRS